MKNWGLIALTLVAALSSCAKSENEDRDDDSNEDGPTSPGSPAPGSPENPKVPGEVVAEGSEVVFTAEQLTAEPNGGFVTSGPLAGLKVKAPAGMVDATTIIRVSLIDGPFPVRIVIENRRETSDLAKVTLPTQTTQGAKEGDEFGVYSSATSNGSLLLLGSGNFSGAGVAFEVFSTSNVAFVVNPAPFRLIYPEQHTIQHTTDATPEIQWAPLPVGGESARYFVNLSTGSCDDIGSARYEGSATSFSPTTALPPGSYGVCLSAKIDGFEEFQVIEAEVGTVVVDSP